MYPLGGRLTKCNCRIKIMVLALYFNRLFLSQIKSNMDWKNSFKKIWYLDYSRKPAHFFFLK